MAKKTPKRTAVVKSAQPPRSSFDEMFPTIARWISQEEGWVELGADDYSRSLARALYGGGIVWEGTGQYGSLDEALRAMEDGIASWLEEHPPDQRTGGEVHRARGGSRRQKPERKLGSMPAPHPPVEQFLESNPTRMRRNARSLMIESMRMPSRPSLGRSSRRFASSPTSPRRYAGATLRDHPPDEHQGSLQGLGCRPVVRPVPGRACPQEGRGEECRQESQGTDRKGDHGNGVLPGRSHTVRKERLSPLLSEMVEEQDEHERINWDMVRIVHSMELLVVENAMRSILREHEAPTWLYQAARDYAERYDAHYGTGLIPASAPMMQEIADFWRDYFGIGR